MDTAADYLRRGPTKHGNLMVDCSRPNETLLPLKGSLKQDKCTQRSANPDHGETLNTARSKWGTRGSGDSCTKEKT